MFHDTCALAYHVAEEAVGRYQYPNKALSESHSASVLNTAPSRSHSASVHSLLQVSQRISQYTAPSRTHCTLGLNAAPC